MTTNIRFNATQLTNDQLETILTSYLNAQAQWISDSPVDLHLYVWAQTKKPVSYGRFTTSVTMDISYYDFLGQKKSVSDVRLESEFTDMSIIDNWIDMNFEVQSAARTKAFNLCLSNSGHNLIEALENLF